MRKPDGPPTSRIRTRPDPTPTLADAGDLLRDLFGAFGDPASIEAWRFFFGNPDNHLEPGDVGLPNDPAQLAMLRRRHRQAARPLLAELVDEVRALSGRPLPKPDDYKRRWTEIVERWNNAAFRGGWDTLPLLCEACGTPVRRRSLRLEGGEREASSFCSEECRQRVKSRRSSKRNRERRKERPGGERPDTPKTTVD